MNKVILMGRLTRDPEVRYGTGENSTAAARYTIAVDRRFKRDGEQSADFISCVTWNRQAETMAQYLHKGSLLGIEGRIQTRSYDNQQGVRVYVTEVITDSVQFLEPKSAGNSQPRNMQNANPYGSASSYSQPDYVDDAFGSFDSNDTLDIASDDLPF